MGSSYDRNPLKTRGGGTAFHFEKRRLSSPFPKKKNTLSLPERWGRQGKTEKIPAARPGGKRSYCFTGGKRGKLPT